MSSDDAGDIIGILGAMILVGSALIARRGRWAGKGWQMAAAWAAIFAALILIGRWIDGRP